MPTPLFKVEVAFADGPNAAAPSWTDISAYVRRRPPLTYSRGNTDETSQFQPGSMRFVVDNTDGRFTPGSSASTSAWGTALKIRRPVRLSIWNGASYTVAWSGTVDDWGAGWVGGKKGETLVSCSDRVAQAGRVTMPALLDGEILSDAPIAFFPMTDPAGSSVAANQSGNLAVPPLIPISNNARGSSGILGGVSFGVGTVGIDDQTQAQFTLSESGTGVVLSGTMPSGTGAASIEAVILVNSTPTQTTLFGSGTGGSELAVEVSTSGVLTARCNSLAATDIGTITGTLVHVAATYNPSGGTGFLRLYVNGVQVDVDSAAAGNASRGNAIVGGNSFGAGYFDGYISHVAFYDFLLGDARIAAHAQALTGFPGETSGARWNRLCRIAGMASTYYAADTGQVEMGVQPTSGQTLDSLLRAVAEAEQGYAYGSADGVLTLKAGTTRYGATSAATYTPQQVARDLAFTTTDNYLVNDAEVTRGGGGTRRTTNATSITDYGRYRETPSLPFLTDDQCESLSTWLVYKYADPGTRARQVTLDVTAKALTASTVLGHDVNTLITLSPLPAPAPASSVPLFIDGLEGSIGDEWSVTFNTSPGTLYDGWTLDTDLLGTGTLLLY
jgi:hypothetical protein